MQKYKLDAEHLMTQNDFFGAIVKFEEALVRSNDNTDKLILAQINRSIGECYLELGKPDKSIKYVHQYYILSQKANNLTELQRAYVTLGRCYLESAAQCKVYHDKKNLLNKSQSVFTKSLNICDKIMKQPIPKNMTERKLNEEIAEMHVNSIYNLGLVSREMSDENALKNAQSYFQKSCQLSSNKKFYVMQLLSLNQYIDVKISDLSIKLLKYFDNHSQQYSSENTSDIIQYIDANLTKLDQVSFTSEMKSTRRAIQELHAQCFIISGNYRKGSKKFKLLQKKYKLYHEIFGYKAKLAMELKHEMANLDIKSTSDTDLYRIGRIFDGLGMFYHAAYFYFIKLSRNSGDKENEIGNFNSKCTLQLLSILSNSNICLISLLNSLRNNLNELIDNYTSQQNFTDATNNGDDVTDMIDVGWAIVTFLESWLGCKDGSKHQTLVVFIQKLVLTLIPLLISIDNVKLCKRGYAVILAVYKLIPSMLENSLINRREIETQYKNLEALIEDKDDDANDLGNDEYRPEFSEYEIEKEITDVSSDSDEDNIKMMSSFQLEELEDLGRRKPNKKNNLLKKNALGETELHLAAKDGNHKKVKQLLEMGIPVDAVDNAGWTPLHDAANHGSLRVVEHLVDFGANINFPGSLERSTPLMEAINGGEFNVAMFLIERGANMWAKNSTGENACDTLYNWRERCKESNCYKEAQYEYFNGFLQFIKEKLGDKYSDWIKQRKGVSSDLRNQPQTVPKPPKKQKQKEKPMPKIDYRHSTTIDHDETDEEIKEEKIKIAAPVEDYRDTMKSFMNRSLQQLKGDSSDEEEDTNQRGIPGTREDWLIDDMGEFGRKKKRNQRLTSPDYGSYQRNVSFKKKRPSTSQIFEEEVRPVKVTKLETESKADINEKNESEDDLFSQPSPPKCSPILVKTKPKSYTASISYKEVVLRIPIGDGEKTVEWLTKECLRRYRSMLGCSSNAEEDSVQLTTDEGEILFYEDSLVSVLGDSSGPIKLKLVSTKHTPDELVTHIDAVKVNTSASYDSSSGISISQAAGLDIEQISNSLLSDPHQTTLNLSNKLLDKTLLSILACIQSKKEPKQFISVNLSNNNINDMTLIKKKSTDYGDSSLRMFFANYSNVESIDFSHNMISGNGFNKFVESLDLSRISTLNLSYNPIGIGDYRIFPGLLKKLPRLKCLSLSNCSITQLATDNITGIMECDRLERLDLSYNPLQLSKCSPVLTSLLSIGCLQHLAVRGCAKMALVDQTSNSSGPSGFLNELISIILRSEGRLSSLDIGDSKLNNKNFGILTKLLNDKNNVLKELWVDENISLKRNLQDWQFLMMRLTNSNCQVSKLTIDMPEVNNQRDCECILFVCRSKLSSLSQLTIRYERHLHHSVQEAVSNKRFDLANCIKIDSADDECNEVDTVDRPMSQSDLTVCTVMAMWELCRDEVKESGDEYTDRCLVKLDEKNTSVTWILDR